MLLKTLSVTACIFRPAYSETILGVTVFTRHGDRTSKHYPDYSLTNLGVQQNFQVGSDYRDIYISSNSSKQILGVSENKIVDSQVFASAPDQSVLLNTATAFLQGMYPPLDELVPDISSEALNNGSEYSHPLGGYQYVAVHGEEGDAPDTIWLKGDEGCPVAESSAKAFKNSREFFEREEATQSFYGSFWGDIQDVYDYQRENLTYANAYDIFDLLNVASIHNASSAGGITEESLVQLRTLADSAEFGLNYDKIDTARSIGGQAFAGGVLNQLSATIASQGKLKFSLMAGSYDTFLAFFGLTNLTSVSPDFLGLPHYASTMAFELFTNEDVAAFPSTTDDLRVRFLFRNGSNAGEQPRAFPLFGTSEDSLSYSDFTKNMQDVAITSPEQWCNTCQSDLLFCTAYNSAHVQGSNSSSGRISNAIAGAIGALVTLGAMLIVGAIAFYLVRRRAAKRDSVDEKDSLSGRRESA